MHVLEFVHFLLLHLLRLLLFKDDHLAVDDSCVDHGGDGCGLGRDDATAEGGGLGDSVELAGRTESLHPGRFLRKMRLGGQRHLALPFCGAEVQGDQVSIGGWERAGGRGGTWRLVAWLGGRPVGGLGGWLGGAHLDRGVSRGRTFGETGAWVTTG